MDEQALMKLTRARANLIVDQPFFGALALRLLMVEDNHIKTLTVNGKRIGYNPNYINSLSSSLTTAIIAHEVMHCVLDHMARIGERSHLRWNQATDYAINQLLEDAGFDFEGTGLLNPIFKEMTADQIYALLPEPDNSGDNGHGEPLDEIAQAEGDIIERESSAQDWRFAVTQAAHAAKLMGQFSDDQERFVSNYLKPKIDWRCVLRRFIDCNSKEDYSWIRPKRNMIVHGVYMPSLYTENIGGIVIAIDTSGSITQATLNAFSAECNAIIAQTRPMSIHVIYCDAEVKNVAYFSKDDAFILEPCGGGGTAFQPVFDCVEAHSLNPLCLIYLTDLFGPTKFPPPTYPTLWCCTSSQVGPFGDTVYIEH